MLSCLAYVMYSEYFVGQNKRSIHLIFIFWYFFGHFEFPFVYRNDGRKELKPLLNADALCSSSVTLRDTVDAATEAFMDKVTISWDIACVNDATLLAFDAHLELFLFKPDRSNLHTSFSTKFMYMNNPSSSLANTARDPYLECALSKALMEWIGVDDADLFLRT